MTKRKVKPAQLAKLKTIDFDKYAKTLFDEAHKGQVHLDILEGLLKVDPFILNQSSMFWRLDDLGTRTGGDDVRDEAVRSD